MFFTEENPGFTADDPVLKSNYTGKIIHYLRICDNNSKRRESIIKKFLVHILQEDISQCHLKPQELSINEEERPKAFIS